MSKIISGLTALLFIACLAGIAQAVEPAETDKTILRDLLQKAVNDQTSFEDQFHAQVWLLDMSSRLKPFIADDKFRIKLLKSIHFEANRTSLPAELMLAVIEVESYFDEFAISVSGARGLMQIMPFWLNEIDLPDKNLFNVQTNLRMGSTILKHYLDLEKGDLTKALARYNGSRGKAIYPNKVFKALNKRWFRQ